MSGTTCPIADLTPKEQVRFISRVMRLSTILEDGMDREDLWWRTDGPYAPVTYFVNANDLVYWAVADAEMITPDNIEALEQSIADVNEFGVENSGYGAWLFVCRTHGMRPQGAFYKLIPAALHPLFDACGPRREVGFGNPEPHPEEKAA